MKLSPVVQSGACAAAGGCLGRHCSEQDTRARTVALTALDVSGLSALRKVLCFQNYSLKLHSGY